MDVDIVGVSEGIGNLVTEIILRAVHDEGFDYLESDGFNYWADLVGIDKVVLVEALEKNDHKIDDPSFVKSILG